VDGVRFVIRDQVFGSGVEAESPALRVQGMEKRVRILVVDRNRNVREFLRREFESEGYEVRVAATGREFLSIVGEDGLLDLLILDPEVSLMNEVGMEDQLRGRLPPLPIVVHCHWEECVHRPILGVSSAFAERGKDVEGLKRVVRKVLSGGRPEGFRTPDVSA
jgi:CheY-like chemotaxis protein